MSDLNLLELKRGNRVMNKVKVIKDTKNNSSKKSNEPVKKCIPVANGFHKRHKS